MNLLASADLATKTRTYMELNLQPLAPFCSVTKVSFNEGDKVISYLIQLPSLEIVRHDVAFEKISEFTPEGKTACSWTHLFKPRSKHDNPERDLKLNAENLFMTLADPQNEPSVETVRLIQFLALMLERKKVLRPKGLNPEKSKNLYEHAKTKQLFEVPVGELSSEFFIAVQQQLSVLVGEGKPKEVVAQAAPAEPIIS
jgi:hypothetical protein